MYRDYESPGALEQYLTELIHKLNTCTDEDTRIDLHNEIEDVKDRIRFAWADMYEE